MLEIVDKRFFYFGNYFTLGVVWEWQNWLCSTGERTNV